MAAVEPSSSDLPPPPPFCRRARRLVFDRRYGWIFDEWTDPAEEALSGGRGMFCVVPTAESLMNAAASSINLATSSVSRALKRPESFSLSTYMASLPLHRKQKAWFRGLEHSGVVADFKLIPSSTHCTLECMTTDCR